MKKYQTRKPTVGDMREIYAENVPPEMISFALAERCIMIDGQPIGADGLNRLPLDEFEKLMVEINVEKKR